MDDVQSANLPKSLYLLSIACVGSNLHKRPSDKHVLRTLPDNVLMDIYYTMLQEDEICNLSMELGDLEIFARLLRELSARIRLLKCFQAVMDHRSNSARDLSEQMAKKCSETDPIDEMKAVETIQLGLRLGGFLSDAGWFTHSEKVLICVRTLCRECKQTDRMMHLTLQCYQRLLQTQSIFYRFEAALETARMSTELAEQVIHGEGSCSKIEQYDPGENSCSEILVHYQNTACAQSESEEYYSDTNRAECSSCETKNIAKVREQILVTEKSCVLNSDAFASSSFSSSCESQKYGLRRHLAALYAELSRLWFNRSDYDASYQYSVTALRHLRGDAPAKVKIDVLRQAAKSCVVKRDFARAGLLIRLAVYLARETFGTNHPKYSDALIDYGFYLLNVDCIAHSVKIYKDALDIKSAIFGVYNLHVAIAHEDLAYALYVHEYSSGRFYKARENAEKAIDIMQRLVPSNHLMLASAKRVKALILEEIALDNIGEENELLYESEKLHLTALELSTMAFGERNVQTAKHYGNLGRLYQSMKKFKEAESMHLKAIEIKEQLLGSDDYEVGLSVGHLASLYNYHMLQYREAETLYHRSIAISLKLFGETYSGLEYDYRGLVHVYHELNDNDKMWQYEETLNRWRQLRRDQVPNQVEIDIQEPISIEDVTRRFFAMCKHK